MAFSTAEAESIVAICLLAATADGTTTDEERERLERIFQIVDGGSHAAVYRRVLMGDASIIDEAANLQSDAARTMAWEMAVGVCEADGRTTDPEREFLRTLEAALGLDHAAAAATLEQGEQMVDLVLEAEDSPRSPRELDRRSAPTSVKTGGVGPLGMAAGMAAGGAIARPASEPGGMAAVPARAAAPGSQIADATTQIDATILRYAIMNGAIELLPQDLATVAVLPLQMRLVYLVGREHGHTLSTAHIKEFLAVAGVGMTSQVLEGYARKLFGKMAKKTLGKTAGKLAKAATGPAITFATTYALGQVAKQYYGGGRTLSAVDLRGIFQRASAEGQQVYQQHAGAVDQRARGLDLGTVMNAVRGKAVV
jgi:tellurite resistance protein/uncharacterized protein (DUF697 family)